MVTGKLTIALELPLHSTAIALKGSETLHPTTVRWVRIAQEGTHGLARCETLRGYSLLQS